MGKDKEGKELGKGIIQRIDGSYMARYVDRYKKRHTFYGRDLKALRRKLEKARYESEQGVMLLGEGITLEKWFEEYFKLYKEGKIKETTAYRIRQTFSPCRKNMIGMMKLQEIRAIHVQQLINELERKGFAYGTIRLMKALLNEMFRKAIGNGYMVINPCNAVTMPKKTTTDARFLTKQEQEMFLEVAKEYMHCDIFYACLASGGRIGEILGLKWTDIDWEKKTLHIQRTLHYGKTKENEVCHFFFTTPKTETSDRIIPILPEMEKVLKRVRKKQLRNRMLHASCWENEEPFDDMVFTTQQGRPIRYGDVNRTIKAVIVKANLQEEELAKIENREPFVLKPFTPHCFRHTFVTRCKEYGISYEEIKPYVGHNDERMTQYYDHNERKINREVLEKISFIGVV